MATKKEAPGTAVKKWEEELAGLAEQTVKTEAMTGGKFIGTKSGQLSFNGAPVPGNKLNVIVMDNVLENQHYEDDFDPDNRSSPVCFAFARDKADLKPHPDAEKPQHDECNGCPMNEFGSAAKGKGKACKNVRRLALFVEAAADSAEDVAAAEIAYIKVPVMSAAGWSAYAQQLNTQLKRPPLAVITEISLVPDPKSQFRMIFKYVSSIDDGEVIQALLARRKALADQIMFPYQKPSEAPAPEPRKQLKGARQIPGRR